MLIHVLLHQDNEQSCNCICCKPVGNYGGRPKMFADGGDVVFRARAPMLMSAKSSPERRSEVLSSSEASQQNVPRVVFPETWLWSETIAG
jgi:hypothetical protein